MNTQIDSKTLIKILGIGSCNFAVMSTGYSLGHRQVFWSAILIITIIIPIISLLQALIIIAASQHHQNTIQLCYTGLGNLGGIVSSTIIRITTLLWFSFNLVLIQKNICLIIGKDISHFLLFEGESVIVFLIFCLGINRISSVVTTQSLILLFLCLKIAYSLRKETGILPKLQPNMASETLAQGAILIPLLLPSLVDLPTWYAQSTRIKKSLLTQLIIIGFCVPCILSLGILIGNHAPYDTFLESVSNDTFGFIGQIIFISSAILGNSTALYLLTQLARPGKNRYQIALIHTSIGFTLAQLPCWNTIETTIKITGAASSALAIILILTCAKLLWQKKHTPKNN